MSFSFHLIIMIIIISSPFLFSRDPLLYRQIASCGLDSVSVVFHNGGLEEVSYQFDIESGSVSSITSVVDVACYKGEEYMVAVATSNHMVLSYSYCSGNINDDPFAEVREGGRAPHKFTIFLKITKFYKF